MRIVAGGAGDPVSRHQRQFNIHRRFILFEVSEHFQGRLHEKMPGLKERIGHGRVTAPAEKSDISPKLDILGPVHLRIRHDRMAYDTDGHAAYYFSVSAALIEHLVGIYPLILLLMMAFETDVPLQAVGPFPQKVGAARFVVLKMAGLAGDPALAERKRNLAERRDIHWMVIRFVIVAAQAIGVFLPGGRDVPLPGGCGETDGWSRS